MFIDSIIRFSIQNKLIIGLLVIVLGLWGGYSLYKLPIDAIPDITSNQVVVLTQSPALAAQEVEQYITTPLELRLGNIQGVTEIRSVSRLGLSVVTVVFDDQVDILRGRQLVGEQLQQALQDIPTEFGTPYLAPITTGLGEIYQYTLVPQPGYKDRYDLTELRSIQDWVVKRQLTNLPGVVEISSFGGFVKQYEISLSPERLLAMEITMNEVFAAVQRNNGNSGGSYLEKNGQAYFIRGEGAARSLDELGQIVIKTVQGVPVLVRDVAEVKFGQAVRYGALTRNGEREAVGAVVLMLKGADSQRTVNAVKERIASIQHTLPEGLRIEPFIERTKLIDTSIRTVKTNLMEGGLIVVFVLILLMGSWRAGLIVASVIPLAMLFTFGMMSLFGVTANLMSLGAIDFGLIVDGSVIVVEAVLHFLHQRFLGQRLGRTEMNNAVLESAIGIRKSAAFGEIIILIVYLPILALGGIEGKMFKPMALTVSFAILGALILSLTYVPMMASQFLSREIRAGETFSDRLIQGLYTAYSPLLRVALRARKSVIAATVIAFLACLWLFGRLGGEFIPQLDEGDIAIDLRMPTGTSLTETIKATLHAQQVLLRDFPEIKQIVGRIGASEVPTDPMPVEMTDQMINLKDQSEWTSAESREELSEKMNKVLMREVPGVMAEFTQPIQMRFNEMITGVRSDLVVKIYGDDLNILFEKANECATLLTPIEGVASCRVEPIVGLPQITARYKRDKLAQYGVDVATLNELLRGAFAGITSGVVFEGERRFDVVVRMDSLYRTDITHVQNLPVRLPDGRLLFFRDLADILYEEAPAQIAHDQTKRRITIGINIQNRDVESLVTEIQELLATKVILPPGYRFTYGGTFENLQQARQRLLWAVPLALALIFLLLYFTFHSIPNALIIFTAVPLSAIGGIVALWLRDMPFSISAGVGFIALFGVAVLNGVVLISYLESLTPLADETLHERITRAVKARFRPVLMTAAVASLGFTPMALSQSGGAEVQRPLATVVIGGLITATLLTLVVLPVLYSLSKTMRFRSRSSKATLWLLLVLASLSSPLYAQRSPLSINAAIEQAYQAHPLLRSGQLQIAEKQALVATAYALPKTEVDFLYGQTQARPIDYTLTAVQGFSSKGLYQAQLAERKGAVKASDYQQEITKQWVSAHVKKAYYALLYDYRLGQLFNRQIAVYTEAKRAAELRVQAGDVGALEVVTADSRLQQLILNKRKLERAQAAHYVSLYLLVQPTDSVEIDTLLPLQRQLTLLAEERLEANPILLLLSQQVENAQLETQVLQKQRMPDWRLGVINQSVEKQYGLSAVQLGMSFHLFTKAEKAKIQAAQLREEVQRTQQRYTQQQLLADWQIRQTNVMSNLEQVRYYESYGLEQARQIERTALQLYQRGAAPYMEFFAAMQQAYQIQEAYLQSQLELSLSIIDLEQLAGL